MKKLMAITAVALLSAAAQGQDDAQALYDKGKELYSAPASCAICHTDAGTGAAGPDITYGPTPDTIHYQLNNNPQMSPINQLLKPSNEDLLALSVYIKTLGSVELADVDIESFRKDLDKIKETGERVEVVLNERDQMIEKYQDFQTVLDTWTRKSQTGNIMKTFDTVTYYTFEADGEQKFFPESGKTYFVQNTGVSASLFGPREPGRVPAKTSKVVIGDAATKEVLVHADIPSYLRGDNHFTAMTPDGKYIYITGGKPLNPDGSGGQTGTGFPMPDVAAAGMGGEFDPFSNAFSSVLKIDSKTLQVVKQFNPGGRMHHIQLFRDKYMLVDTFSRDDNGLDVFLMDPETDEVIGGVRDEELGGITYTSFSDDKFIYILMQPAGYPGGSISGYQAGIDMGVGKYTMLRPFWVAKVDPDTWEVVGEYPYPGYRGDWVAIDGDENIYVPAGASSSLHKIDTKTGEVVWTQSTGIGPYGAAITADGREVWVADKGETTNMFGRTITVISTRWGRQVQTLFSGYQVDHVLLAPNGKEMWATSNAEGRLYVFDTETYENTHVIEMPGRGDAHGLVWLHVDDDGSMRVVADQGDLHNGVTRDNLLDY